MSFSIWNWTETSGPVALLNFPILISRGWHVHFWKVLFSAVAICLLVGFLPRKNFLCGWKSSACVFLLPTTDWKSMLLKFEHISGQVLHMHLCTTLHAMVFGNRKLYTGIFGEALNCVRLRTKTLCPTPGQHWHDVLPAAHEVRVDELQGCAIPHPRSTNASWPVWSSLWSCRLALNWGTLAWHWSWRMWLGSTKIWADSVDNSRPGGVRDCEVQVCIDPLSAPTNSENTQKQNHEPGGNWVESPDENLEWSCHCLWRYHSFT